MKAIDYLNGKVVPILTLSWLMAVWRKWRDR
jgi:hypothetical protein